MAEEFEGGDNPFLKALHAYKATNGKTVGKSAPSTTTSESIDPFADLPLKKKQSTVGSKSGAPSLPSGLGVSPNFLPPTEQPAFTPVTDPSTRQQLQQQAQQQNKPAIDRSMPALQMTRTQPQTFAMDETANNPIQKELQAYQDQQDAQAKKQQAQHPGSWKNLAPVFTHAIVKMGTDLATFGGDLTRDIIGKTDPNTLAAKPLYKQTPIYNKNGTVIGYNSELSDYGKTVKNGEKDPLGNFVLALNAYTNETANDEEQNGLPKTFAGNTVNAFIKMAPDIAMASLIPEAELIKGEGVIGSLKNAVQAPFTKLLAAKGAIEDYNQGKQSGDGVLGAAEGAVGGAIKGGGEGVLFHSLGDIAGNYVSKPIYNTLIEKGLVKGGQYTKAGLDALSDAAVFGAYPIASDLVQGKPIDWNEVQAGVGTGLGFGLMKAGKTFGEHENVDQSVADITKDRQALALTNFLGASDSAIEDAWGSKENSADLLGKAVEYAHRVKEEPDLEKKTQLAAAASTYAKVSDIKGTLDAIMHDKDGFVQSIAQSDLPNEQKSAIINKINTVYNNTHPVESQKTDLGASIKDVDSQIKALEPQITSDDPIASTEAQVRTEALNKQKEELTKNLKSTIETQIKEEGKKATPQAVEAPTNKDSEVRYKNIPSDEFLKLSPEEQMAIDNNNNSVFDEANKVVSESNMPIDEKILELKSSLEKKGVPQADFEHFVNTNEEGDLYIEAERELSKLFKDPKEEEAFYKSLKGNPTLTDLGKKISQLRNEPTIENPTAEAQVLPEQGSEVPTPTNETVKTNIGGQENATETRNVSKDNQPEHQEGNQVGSEKITSSSDRPEQGGEKQQEVKAGDAIRSFADKVRQGKINKLGGFKAATGFDAVWDGSLEVVATSLEAGAKVVDAIEAGLKYAKNTAWYKQLTNKEEFDKQYRAHLTNEYATHEESSKETSIKNATVTEERTERGLPEVERLAKRTFPEVYERAKEALDKGEIDPRSLAEYISKNPRSLTPEESVILALDRMKISNEYADVTERLKDAYEKGDMDTAGALEHRLSVLEQQSEYNDEASVRAGYEQGLGLAVRQMIIKEDYTYLKKLNEAKVANEGKTIPQDVRDKIEDLTNRLKENLKRQEELEAKVAKLEAESKVKRETGTVRQRPSTPKKSLKEDLSDIYEDFKKEFKNAARTSTLKSDIPYRQELYAASKFILRVSKRLVEEGITDISEISKRVIDLFKDDIEGITPRDVHDVLAGRYSEPKKTKTEVSKELADLRKQADLLNKIEDAELGVKRATTKSHAKASEKVQQLRDKYNSLTKDDRNLEQAKKRISKRQEELKKMLATGDYARPERSQTPYDFEYNKLKAETEKLKRQIDGEIYKLRQQNRTKLEKSLDYINAYRRAAILSRISTLFKLGAAATERLITTPIEEGIGSVINKIPGISKIAKQAPREGGNLSLKAEAAAISDTFSKRVLQDVAETIKHGHGSLDFAHGKRIPIQAGGFEGVMEFPGKLHGAIKVIPKRNEFFRAFEKRVAFAEKQGLDINNELVKTVIEAEAYKDAQRSIFMSDNLLTDKYRQVIRSLENSKNPNSQNRDRIAAAIMKYMLPIVKVPTNFALETTNYAAGALRALPHIIKAAKNGADSLTPEQADFVLRALKKNSVGLAMLALGYFNPNAIGGYYQQGEKRKESDAQVGDVNVYGVHLPHFLLHAPVLEVLQIGATLRRVKDKYERKHHGKSGNWAGTVAAAGGVASDIPFFDAPRRLGDAIKSEKGAEYYLGEQVKSLVVPGLIQEGAELGDKKTNAKVTEHPLDYILAKPQKRQMEGVVDHIQSGIPGWRNMLPKNKK